MKIKVIHINSLIIVVLLIIAIPPFLSIVFMVINEIWMANKKGSLIDELELVDKAYSIRMYHNPSDIYNFYFKFNNGTEEYITSVGFYMNFTKLLRIDSLRVGIVRTAYDSSFVDTTFIQLE